MELNSTTGKFYVRQMINTNHVGGIAKVFGKKARIYSVGGSDSILQVWWLNTTTQVWSLTLFNPRLSPSTGGIQTIRSYGPKSAIL
jgi:hypothetical protein